MSGGIGPTVASRTVVRLLPHLPLRTDRVRLRRSTPADLSDFQAYRHDPEVGRYQGWTPLSDVDAEAFLATMQRLDDVAAGEWLQIGIADVDDDRLVGDCAVRVHGDPREAELGFTLARPAQGRGLGRDAVRLLVGLVFATTPVVRVVAITDARNAPSRRLLAAVGFQHAGTDEASFRGERCVEHTFVVARAEWPEVVRAAGS